MHLTLGIILLTAWLNIRYPLVATPIYLTCGGEYDDIT